MLSSLTLVHTYLIASVSKLLIYLKANLNSSAGIISHPGNWIGIENSFSHNFKVTNKFTVEILTLQNFAV